MFEIVTRSRFRRTKLDTTSQTNIVTKIAAAMERDDPIEFTIPFGAYKHWLLPSFPYPDWAEVFNLKHMIAFAGPIVQNYPPGVVLNYTHTSGVLEKVSNLPTKCLDEYAKAFKILISYFQQIVPPNLKLKLVDIRKSYQVGELELELENNFSENVRMWEHKYPGDVLAKKLKSARNNLVLMGIEDLTELGPQELEKRYLESAMWCDALDGLSLRREFNKYSHRIQLVFIRGPNLSLHVGSCRASNTQFVIGTGVVEKRNNSLMETIVSVKKLKYLIDNDLVKNVSVKGCAPVRLSSLQRIFVTL